MAFGTEPGGGMRFIAGGLRVLRTPNGGILTSEERFLDSTPKAFALPPRLGGGALFVVGKRALLRSDSWLSAARSIYTSPTDIADVWLGLDRLYVRAPNGSLVAVDPRKGGVVDLGPWPKVPTVTSYRALDGWRAAAIADLRGAMASFDAGATWRPLDLPVDPQSVATARVDPATGETFEVSARAAQSGDFLFVRGPEATHQCFAVVIDGPPAKLPACPSRDIAPEAAAFVGEPEAARIFGTRPLLAAVEDGWPLEPGGVTALIARDGALGRVRLSDGAWLAVRFDAFPSKPSRCHPLRLLVDSGAPGLGFACAEPRGKTVIYACDPSHMTLTQVRTFDDPREVLSFANGAVAVRGPCEARGEPADRRYCIFARGSGSSPASPGWAEVRVPGDANPRLLVRADGRVAVLSPPQTTLDDAHLTSLAPSPTSVKLSFPVVSAEVQRALESGVWLDGFEEREPGVFGGWVDASGSMLGVEVHEDGHVRVGAYIRDAGSPMVSGRYGLGWTASRRGYQTIDGGLTWTAMEVPDALSVTRERACGPVGCTAAGWIRVGWGATQTHAPEMTAPTAPAYHAHTRDLDLDLECESDGTPQASPQPPPGADVGFYGATAPAMRAEDQVVRAEANGSIDRSARLGPLARIFAWGPRSEDWVHVGRWAVQWLWPYGGPRDVRTAAPSLAPFASLDAARRILLGGGPINLNWSLAIGDESTSALLIGKRFGVVPEVTSVLDLEAERSPVEVRRADGEPFADVDFAIRSGGHWYVVTQPGRDEARAAVVYRVDGSEAREFARVPRASAESHARLARRTDGRAVGVVVEGAPPDALRWVLPLDIETGAAAEPEPLGSADMGDRPDVLPCTDEATGWLLDTTWTGQAWSAKARIDPGHGKSAFYLRNLYVRVRLSTHQACVEQVSGSYDVEAHDTPSAGVPALGARNPRADDVQPKPSLPVSVLQGHSRQLLRCRVRGR